MINSVILLLIDALVIFVSIGVGMRWHAAVLSHRQPKSAPAPNFICGCQHELAYHDPATNVCNQIIEKGHYAEKKGVGAVWVTELLQCPCRQYTGELTADWYARTILSHDTSDQKELDA